MMVVGLNNYQDPLNKHKYFCASMVSMNGCFTRYYSYVESLCKKDISEFYVLTIFSMYNYILSFINNLRK